jgi:hypothetical protein
MLQSFGCLHPLVRVFPDQFFNKIDSSRRHRFGEGHILHLAVYNFFHSLFATEVIEGSLSCEKFERKNAKTPQINAPVVLLPLKDFWGRVVKSSTVCFSPLVADGRPTKIAQLADVLNS